MDHIINVRPEFLLMTVLSLEVIIDAVEEEGQRLQDDHCRHDVVNAVDLGVTEILID